MSDDERFERDLRDAILRDVPPAAPGELRGRVARIPDARSSASSRPGRHAAPAWAGVGVAAAVVVVLAGGLFALARPAVGPAASPATLGSPPTTATAPAPTPSAAASPVVGPEVDEYGLTDAMHGWAKSGGRLFLTADGGQTWTFVDRPADGLVAFIDEQHGWYGPLRSTVSGPAVVERTIDGGRSWQSGGTIPSVLGVPRGLRFFDTRHGLLPFEGSAGQPGSLWSTADGGASWSRVAAIPAAIVGAITFSDAETGWALAASDPNPPTGRPSTDQLYVTRDGGATWKRSLLPAPPAGWSAGLWLPLLEATPSVFGPGQAVLAAWYGNGVSGETQLLVTDDAGASWTVAAIIPSLVPVPIDALDAKHWVAGIPGQDGTGAMRISATDDGGRTWRALADVADGSANYLEITFADRLHGWTLDNGDVSLQLYATDDGGASWRLLRPRGGPTPTPQPCSADSVVLGPMPALASADTTPWFNVFPAHFDPNSPVTISFDTPVIAWAGQGAPTGPLGTFIAPPGADGGKFTFRPADQGVARIIVRMDGGGCSATTTVDLSSPGGTTAP